MQCVITVLLCSDSRVAAGLSIPAAVPAITSAVLASAAVLSVVLGALIPGPTEELRASSIDDHSSSAAASTPETSSSFC